MSNTPSPVSVESPTVVIGEKRYHIKPFVPGKIEIAIRLISRLIDEGEILSLFGASGGNMLPIIINKVPQLLETGAPALMKLCALVLTTNAELRRMEENDEDIDAYLEAFGKTLKWEEEYGIDKIIDTLVYGLEQINIASARKNFQRLRETLTQTTKP